MRLILLMRHGKSDWDFAGVSDFNRPLSEKGIQDVLRQGQALLKTGYRPDRILSSPAIRAWHTAHLMAQVTSLPHEAVQAEAGFYREEVDAIYHALQSLPQSVSTVLLVGHNPLWSELASKWAQSSFELSTSEIVGFGYEGGWNEIGVTFSPFSYLFYLRRTG
ncbi:MAG: histidine phosphatase family protein [Bacteroidia bacterium]|nr:histidine phosphatase family protein [Bacteroidia bacterium]MDW8134401.1 histidine phosphatase family protein [Bacteroidia bacterium]